MAPFKSGKGRNQGKLIKSYSTGFVGSSLSPSLIFSASGGNLADGLQPGNGYAYHTFSSSGTLSVFNAGNRTFECLIVGGGGAGGGASGNAGCGGGGGGVAHLQSFPFGVNNDTLSIIVGAGGAGGLNVDGVSGTGSSITTPVYNVIANGGGGGGANQGAGAAGGSGGGNLGAGNQPTLNPGNPFVTNYGTTAIDQGGAGSGSGGGPGVRQGGIGTFFSGFEYNAVMETPVFSSWPGSTDIVPLPGNFDNEYGGGGQGYGNTTYVIGGGGASRNPATGAGFPGTNYLGGGGGGGWFPTATSGGNGGAGVVIIRYQV